VSGRVFPRGIYATDAGSYNLRNEKLGKKWYSGDPPFTRKSSELRITKGGFAYRFIGM
jgi:hypothetical protein